MMQAEDQKQRFSKVVLAHVHALNHFAFSLCRNAYDADDLVSATVLKALEGFSALKDECKAKQWLFKILNNQFISNYRDQKRYIETEIYGTEHDNGSSDTFSLFKSLSESDFVEEGNPEKKFISKLTQEQIKQAVGELPQDFRAALILCDMEDFSYAEISAILNIPIGTVRSRIARARTLLQKKLWLQAKQLGIGKAREIGIKKEYVCTCGREETASTATTTS
jgi:RNA polymerase sigma factor (sigma-70 family)